jgi:hypothetical protein
MADEEEREDDQGREIGDLGGIGEKSGSLYLGEDGFGSMPHMPIEEEPHRDHGPRPGDETPLDDDR